MPMQRSHMPMHCECPAQLALPVPGHTANQSTCDQHIDRHCKLMPGHCRMAGNFRPHHTWPYRWSMYSQPLCSSSSL